MINSSIDLSLSSLHIFQMNNSKNNHRKSTESCNTNVTKCQEVIPSSKCISSRHIEILSPTKFLNIPLVINLDKIVSFLSTINTAIKLLKVRKICRSHPNNKVFICLVPPLNLFPFTICCSVFKLLNVTFPSDVCAIYF